MGKSTKLAPRGAGPLVLLSFALAACGGGGDEGTGGDEQVKAWSDPVQISFDTGNVSAPAITADANGNATAIFRDHDGTKWGAGVNRYTAGNGWGSPQLINTTAASPQLFSYDIAAAPSGLVVAAWSQVVGPSGSVYDTWTSRLPVGGTWSGAIKLSAIPAPQNWPEPD